MAPVATESTAHADGRVGRRIENYAGFWQKDLSQEDGQDTENRLANYTDVINGEFFLRSSLCMCSVLFAAYLSLWGVGRKCRKMSCSARST